MNTWQSFSVRDFCDRGNWSGEQLQTSSISATLQEVSWLCQSTADFFSRSNWQGEILTEISQSSFSLTLTVNELFQLFAWNTSSTTVTPLPQLEPLPQANFHHDELKLDDLGNLF